MPRVALARLATQPTIAWPGSKIGCVYFLERQLQALWAFWFWTARRGHRADLRTRAEVHRDTATVNLTVGTCGYKNSFDGPVFSTSSSYERATRLGASPVANPGVAHA